MKNYTLYDVAKYAYTFNLDFFTYFELADDNTNPYVYRDIGPADGYIMSEDLHDNIAKEMYDKHIIIISDDVIASYLQEKMDSGCHDILEASWFFNLDEQLKNYIIIKVNPDYDGRQMLTVKYIDEVEA